MPLPIEHLPLRTQSLLRSTCQLPSFASILETLIQNSLEASSTSLELSIDLSTYTLKCKDNGTGISWTNLCLLDKGGRYSTNRDSEGTRGEGLESIQDVGYLQVRTRSRGEGSEWSRRGGETVELRKLNHSGTREEGQGTTVIVRDIFYNFPVRRKLVSTSVSSTLSTIRSLVSNISLIHPTISFQLSDISLSTPKTLVSVRNCSQGVLGRWRQLWGRSGIERVWEFDQQSHHKEGTGIEAKGFVSLSASHGKGNQFIFVNSQPLPSHSILHKSLNLLFTRSSFSRHSSSLLSFPSPNSPSLNNSRSNSPTVGAKGGRNTPKKTVEKWPIFLIDLRVPIDQVEFARGLGGEGDSGWIEFTDEKRVVEFVEGIAKEFLIGHGFLSEAVATGRGGGEGGKRKRIEPELEEEEEPLTREVRRSRLDSNGATPQQSQSTLNDIGRKQISADIGGIEQEAIKRRRISSTTPQRQPQPQLRVRVEDLNVAPNTSSTPLVNPASDPFSTTTKTWTDPTTHQAFEIDPRTGNNSRIDPIFQRNGAQDGREKVEGKGAECEGCVEGERGEGGERRGIVDRRSLKRGRGSSEIREGTEEGSGDREKVMPEWLKTSLAEWDNPIFPSAPPRRTHQIPSLLSTLTSTNPLPSSSKNPFLFSSSKPSLSSSSTRKPSQAPATLTHSRLSKLASFFSSSTSPLSTSIIPSSSTSFSRESLEEAHFIAQVDEKYLLVKLPLSEEEEGEGLVMFDQHAVSERIRVERYLEGLCREEGVEVVELEEEVGVVVGREEARELDRWREEFERWGFKFEKRTRSGRGRKEDGGDYVQVWIKTVPKIVKERLSKDPKLLQELVRGYLAQLEENPPRGEGGGSGWIGKFKSCPGGLVELINSKACRGAIMFNDRLSDEQAKDLLKQLAETRFPFRCAHARPSIVPIVNLPAPATTEARGGDRKGEGRRKIDWSLLT